MVFYITYKVSKECGNKSLISRRLKALGCKRICDSFWEVSERKIDEVLKVIGDNQSILLKRTREIRRPIYNDNGDLIDFGSLIVLIYNPPENNGSSKIKLLLARAPYIRLCRSVYAFPQNSDQYEKKGDAFGINNLLTIIKEYNKGAKILSRIIIVNSSEIINVLTDNVKLRVKKKVEKILSGYKDLINIFSTGQIEKKHFIEREKKLYNEFKHLRRLALFYEKWLRIDFTKEMIKIYSVMRKTRLLSKSNYT